MGGSRPTRRYLNGSVVIVHMRFDVVAACKLEMRMLRIVDLEVTVSDIMEAIESCNLKMRMFRIIVLEVTVSDTMETIESCKLKMRMFRIIALEVAVSEIMEAIECYLKRRGDRDLNRSWGYVHIHVHTHKNIDSYT